MLICWDRAASLRDVPFLLLSRFWANLTTTFWRLWSSSQWQSSCWCSISPATPGSSGSVILDLVTCKWSSGGSLLFQIIIRRIRPLANDHPEDLASCKWSSGGTGLLQITIHHPCFPSHPCHPSHLYDRIHIQSRGHFSKQFFLVYLPGICLSPNFKEPLWI